METAKSNKLIPVLVVLLVVASFLIGSLYTKVQFLEKGTPTAAANNAGVAEQPTVAADAAPAEGTPVDVDIAGAPVLGNKDAKIAIVEFTDYQCPFCKQLFDNAFQQIKKEYVDTGKVQYISMDFPLFQIHPQAQKAAEAASCAGDQGKFWEYHDTLFKNQQALQEADLKKYAVDLGLNAGTFNSCLDTGKHTQKVKDDLAAGETYGVRGTPATFVGKVNGNTVNGVQVSGAVPFETFKATVDPLL